MNLQTYTLDIDDPKALKELSKKLHKRRQKLLESKGYKEITFNGSKFNADSIMPALEKIWSTDLTSIYGEDTGPTNYYVYAHCNPLDQLKVGKNLKHLFLAIKFPNIRNVPFYIGKGIGTRYLDTNRNDSHRKIKQSITAKNLVVEPVLLMEGLTSSKAFEYEAKLIDILGLISLSQGGLLANLDEGRDFVARRRLYPADSFVKTIINKNGYTY